MAFEEQLTQEGLYHRALRLDMRRQDKRRREDPTARPRAELGLWVVYSWDDEARQWLLAGFTRTRHIRLETIRRARKKLRIPKKRLVKIMDLFEAAIHGKKIPPPTRYITSRPDAIGTIPLRARDTVIPMILS